MNDDNDPFHPNHPQSRGPVVPTSPNRKARRAEQAKARRNRATRRIPVPRTLPPDIQGNHVQLARAACVLDAINAYGERWLGDATMHELNEGQMLTFLIERTAEMFGPSGVALDRCAELLHVTMEIAEKRRLVDAVYAQSPAGHAADDEPAAVAALLDRMVTRGPSLREELLKDGSGPMANLIVRQLLIRSINLTALHRMQQPSADLLDVSADVLWLCRALAFAEGVLVEPEVAQA